jgi:hypothetical protein
VVFHIKFDVQENWCSERHGYQQIREKECYGQEAIFWCRVSQENANECTFKPKFYFERNSQVIFNYSCPHIGVHKDCCQSTSDCCS